MNKYDLIVVGTSFAASFFLKKYLSKAGPNAKVLVLERGYFYPYAERLKAQRGEHSSYNKPLLTNKNAIVNNNKEKPWIFQIAYGGNSNCWVGCTPRFLPNDFRMKTLYGVGTDWPISYDELAPYYDEVESIMNISGPEETPFPKSTKYPLPSHLFSTVDQVLHKQYNQQYISQPTARARVAVGKRNACCVSNECKLCPMNAKFTIENSELGVHEDSRVEVVYGAQVIQLDVEGSRIENVVYLKDNQELKAAAEKFALGANAIFNAHILLNSGDTNKNTGRGIGEQLGVSVTVKLKDFDNVGGSTHVTANGYMLYDGDHRKEAAACLIESSNTPFIRMEKGKFRHMAVFRLIFEDLPDNNNYVGLTNDRQKPEVHFSDFTSYAKKGLERAKQKLPELLSCLPVEDIEFEKPYNTESHILGTTRMSQSPVDGVVDKNLIHHTYRNLFVLGSGTFTTYTPSNPTLTLSALSLYAADKSF